LTDVLWQGQSRSRNCYTVLDTFAVNSFFSFSKFYNYNIPRLIIVHVFRVHGHGFAKTSNAWAKARDEIKILKVLMTLESIPFTKLGRLYRYVTCVFAWEPLWKFHTISHVKFYVCNLYYRIGTLHLWNWFTTIWKLELYFLED
jgi:hypothetical protein